MRELGPDDPCDLTCLVTGSAVDFHVVDVAVLQQRSEKLDFLRNGGFAHSGTLGSCGVPRLPGSLKRAALGPPRLDREPVSFWDAERHDRVVGFVTHGHEDFAFVSSEPDMGPVGWAPVGPNEVRDCILGRGARTSLNSSRRMRRYSSRRNGTIQDVELFRSYRRGASATIQPSFNAGSAFRKAAITLLNLRSARTAIPELARTNSTRRRVPSSNT